MKIILFFLSFWMGFAPALADEPAKMLILGPTPPAEPTAIPPTAPPVYPPWKLGLRIETDSVDLGLASLVSAEELTFRPSQSNYAGVILGYQWLSGTIAFAIPASREIREKEGQSRYTDLRASYFTRKWGIEAGYNRYLGYLIEESDRLSPATLNGSPFYRLPRMESFGYGVNFFTVAHPEDYSMPAAFDQSQPQYKSGGSLLGLASFRHQSFQNDGPILPFEKFTAYGEDGMTTGLRSTCLAIGGGYGYLWDGPASFFVAGFLGATYGVNHMTQEMATTESSRTTGQANAMIRLAFGLNGRRGFATISAAIDAFGYSTRSIRVSNSTRAGVFSAGVRF